MIDDVCILLTATGLTAEYGRFAARLQCSPAFGKLLTGCVLRSTLHSSLGCMGKGIVAYLVWAVW